MICAHHRRSWVPAIPDCRNSTRDGLYVEQVGLVGSRAGSPSVDSAKRSLESPVLRCRELLGVMLNPGAGNCNRKSVTLSSNPHTRARNTCQRYKFSLRSTTFFFFFDSKHLANLQGPPKERDKLPEIAHKLLRRPLVLPKDEFSVRRDVAVF